MAEARTIQIRGIAPEVADDLERAAKARGQTLSAYLRDRLTEIADRRRIWQEWWDKRPAPLPAPQDRQAQIDADKAERDAAP